MKLLTLLMFDLIDDLKQIECPHFHEKIMKWQMKLSLLVYQ